MSYNDGLIALNLPTCFDRRESLFKSFHKVNFGPDSKMYDYNPNVQIIAMNSVIQERFPCLNVA